jgi:ribonuclease D
VDTEFVRRSTYWAKLALIQVAGPTMVGLIDVLSPELEMEAIKELLIDPDILKVFHSARQDFEVIWQSMKILPVPFYDTQIAAMACGFGDCVGYDALVSHYKEIKLDKSQQFTDWAIRPLKEEQLKYAAKDVIYLRQVYEGLLKELVKKQRTTWVKEEMNVLGDYKLYEINPREAWKRLKMRPVMKKIDLAKFAAFVQEIAAWREEQAQQKNIPRLWILKDENIFETALLIATQPKALKRIDHLLFKKGDKLPLEKDAYNHLKSTLQKIVETSVGLETSFSFKKPLDTSLQPLFEFLCFFLKYRCEQLGIVNRLLTVPAEIEQFLLQDHFPASFLKGWRWENFGQEAKGFKEGKKAVYFNKEFKTIDI